MSRRTFIGASAGAAVAAGTLTLGARPAHAHSGFTHPANPAPSPIGATVPSGVTTPAFLENIHWLLPGPIGVLHAPDGSRVFFAHTTRDAVGVVDPETLEVERWIEAGDEPDGMAWVP